MMKRSILITLICSILLVVLPAVSSAVDVAGSELKDISKHWAKGAIEQAVVKGYVSGYPEGTFQPDKPVSRAEFIRMLVDALKLPHVEQGSPWYQPYVSALVEIGIHKETDFKSDYINALSRLEMVRLAVRATDLEMQKATSKVSDKQFMFDATTKGIVHGMTNGDLAPQGTSTRAQAVAIIERILAVKAGAKLPTDKRAVTYAEVDLKGTNIESMWGVKANPMPQKLDLGSKLDITVDKIIIFDGADEDRAYMDLFPTFERWDRTSVKDDYVVTIHVNVINNNMKDTGHWDFYAKSRAHNAFYTSARIPVSYRNEHTATSAPSIWLDKTPSGEGWITMAIPKKKVESGFKKIMLQNLVFQRIDYLTPEE